MKRNHNSNRTILLSCPHCLFAPSWLIQGLLGDANNMIMMIPNGNPYKMQFMQQGVPTSSHLGRDQIVMFVHGNLSESLHKDLYVN
jgi:hypothetical protein